jgi:hypothetical protein
MNMSKGRTLLLGIALGTAVLLVVVLQWGLSNPSAAGALARRSEPVVLKGADFSSLKDAPLDELALYAFRGGVWRAIPFQIDEVTSGGRFTRHENGKLDENDELVFMSQDGGEASGPGNWVDDSVSKTYPRYAISVTDPLAPGTAWYAYLYRSSGLGRSATRYVMWDQALQQVSTPSYTAHLGGSDLIGIAGLYINETTTDLVDRQQIRVKVDNPWPFPNLTVTESDLVTIFGLSGRITPSITGAVRMLDSGTTAGFTLYAGQMAARIRFDPASIQLPLQGAVLDSIRVSLDWNDPSVTGFAPATYYDSNTPDGVPIDGVPDIVANLPPLTWYEVTGSYGTLVMDVAVKAGNDELMTFYLDNSTLNSQDTGDGRSFGNAGLQDNRTGEVMHALALTQTAYILPSGVGNVGDTVAKWAHTPLEVNSTVETWAKP